MAITNFSVSFRRQVQPASYEAAEAEVSFNGVVPEGTADEDAAKASASALTIARRQALLALGLKSELGPQEPVERKPIEQPATTTNHTAPAESEDGPKATAATRAFAEENGVDLANVAGTGKDGRVTKADVEAYMKANSTITGETVGDTVVREFDPTAEQATTDDVMGFEPEQPARVYSDADLQTACAGASKRLGAGTKVKEVIASYGVTFVRDIPQDKRQQFIDEVDALGK